MTFTPRKLLLVTPAFHDYWRSIQKSWEQLGYEVVTVRYDDYSTARDKLRNKLFFELPERLGADGAAARAALATQRACTVLEETRPDLTLVIKGDTLNSQFWDALDRSGSKRLLWLYDELRRTQWTKDDLERGKVVASYSRDDVAHLTASGFEAHHLPLAFDPRRSFTPVPSKELVFVGARYAKREATLMHLVENGIQVRAYGRDWSTHVIDRLCTWNSPRPEVPSGRDLTLEQAWGRMAGAPSTLNVHGDQDGFTMRTFEACGVGGVQLIDRTDVEEFYEPGHEILAYSNLEELVDLARRASSDFKWGAKIRASGRRRTLAEHTFLHRAKEANE